MFNFFAQQPGHDAFVIAVYDQEDLVALCCGAILFSGGFFKRKLTRRAIIIGGPLIAPGADIEVVDLLLSELNVKLKKKAIYAEIRNQHSYDAFREVFTKHGWQYKAHLNFEIASNTDTAAMKNLSGDKRRQVRKSLKEGAEIIEANEEDEVQQFYEILADLYRTKVKTPLPPFTFFSSFLKSGLGKYLLIKYKDQVIGGIMCPILPNRVVYDWYRCGLDRQFKNVYPSVLAAWAGIDYANKHNIEKFDFMGAGSPDKDYGVRKFKAQFGGQLVENGRFIKIYRPTLYRIGEQAVKLLRKKS